MTDDSDRLQEALERLEAGESLEALLPHLPEDEARLLKLAADLKSAPWPALSPGVAAAQKQAGMRLVEEKKHMSSSKSSIPRWAWGGVALAGGLAVLFVCVLAGAGILWWRSTTVQGTVVQSVRGLVEVQAPDWRPARPGEPVAAGTHVRTGALSGATVALGDGSVVRLGPDTEITFTTLDTPANGPRVVRLNQVKGESDHTVAHSANSASIYEVSTPAGSGVAKGTVFQVQTAAEGGSRFDVQEGAVAVSNGAATVTVLAGQFTQVGLNEPPAAPSFRVTGEGVVTSRGDVWVVAGRTFATNAATTVVDDPQIGDWVTVEGSLLPGGAALAERIVLVRRASVENQFAFVGLVDSVSETQWVIAGRQVNVDAQTQIDAGLEAGSLVRVDGRLGEGGALWAVSIQEVESSGFQFVGVVQSIAADQWRIADITVTVGVSTTIVPGLKVGDRVQVNGEIQPDGTWLALLIQPVKVTTFDFVGVVIRMNPWNVSGVELATDADTDIDSGIRIGNRVHVTGRVLPDGTWLAETITQVDEGQRHAIQFTARVQSISPWVVGGVTVTVDSKTKITGDITVGDLVLVKGNLLPDGSVVANEITRVSEAAGCMEAAGVVAAVNDHVLTLMDGMTVTVTSEVKVTGDLRPGSVILIRSCLNKNAQLVVVSITVLYQLGDHKTQTPTGTETPTPTGTLVTATATETATPTATGTLVTPTGTPTQLAPGEQKVTICHNASKKNPHTITIARPALPAHLAHGDTLGPCP